MLRGKTDALLLSKRVTSSLSGDIHFSDGLTPTTFDLRTNMARLPDGSSTPAKKTGVYMFDFIYPENRVEIYRPTEVSNTE